MAGVLSAPAAFALDERVLLLSAFPTEQAKLLASAEPVAEVGVFNGRRFFTGTIEGKNVLMGLTGIGMVDAHDTTQAALDYCVTNSITVTAIIFSGVAGAGLNVDVGDVVIPNRWLVGQREVSVSDSLYAVAENMADADNVTLNACLSVEDAACTGEHLYLLPTSVCGTAGKVRVGGLGYTYDPFVGRAVPCLSSAGNLLGCEACGAPPNMSPGIEKFATDAAPFADPFFFVEVFQSFSSLSPSGAVVQDMETAVVADLAADNGIPFLGFRAISDATIPEGGAYPVEFFVKAQLAADNAATVVIKFFQLL